MLSRLSLQYFSRVAQPTTPGFFRTTSRSFDQSLKSRDPAWGVRNLEDVCQAAESQGLVLKERIEMPANNLSLVFQRKT